MFFDGNHLASICKVNLQRLILGIAGRGHALRLPVDDDSGPETAAKTGPTSGTGGRTRRCGGAPSGGNHRVYEENLQQILFAYDAFHLYVTHDNSVQHIEYVY